MSPTRIYLPLDAARLRDLATTRVLGPAPLAAHGVTSNVRAGDPNGDQEGWEYVALGEAAEASAASLPAGERRRVVAAADVDDSWVSAADADGVASAVTVSQPVPMQRIASFHVDEKDVADDDELLWYDVTELDGLLDLL
jgi:hypothetical protein